MSAPSIKTVDVTIKALDPEDPAGSFEAILSAPTLDRDGEIIDAGAFEPLPDFLSVDVDHHMATLSTVASGVPFYDDDLLKIRGTFATTARAQEVRTLVAEGHVRFMSVAFMAAKYADDDEHDDGHPHIVKGELLNAAITPVPSNREAAIVAAKSLVRRAAIAKDAGDLAGEDGNLPGDATTDPDGSSAAAAAADEAAAAATEDAAPAHEGDDDSTDETSRSISAALRDAALLEADDELEDLDAA